MTLTTKTGAPLTFRKRLEAIADVASNLMMIFIATGVSVALLIAFGVAIVAATKLCTGGGL